MAANAKACFELYNTCKVPGTGGSGVKNLPARVGDASSILGWEEPLEKEMATHSSILVWEIPWTEEPGGLQSVGSQRVRHDLVTKQHYIRYWHRWYF